MALDQDQIALAAKFINNTRSHIFLTGKAGTGKTTFLKNLADQTHKKYIIVAPTGIAALNTGGVTIHSQFLLPFGTFLPGPLEGKPPQGLFYNANMLARRHPLNTIRRKVLRSIELLVIDEVSMLRADLLDALDYRLKAVRRNFSCSFGGVQLLLVGDLYQLPPVVKDSEAQLLRRFYKSPFFFESVGLKKEGFTYIELDKIFRQHDQSFISILNNLRDGRCTPEDLQALNEKHTHTLPDSTPESPLITLTTHNYQADRLNQQELKKLSGDLYTYEAEVEGDFPEHLFPLSQKLELKVGAQIMFIRNDSEENRFFNGKLAQVMHLEKDLIKVKMAGEEDLFEVPSHTWHNKKYQLNQHNELEEDVVGSFTHFPIKLAWAITVHKSQGLTFDRAIIDVSQAFAPGQVYVALSRLRSLDGLILRKPIHPAVVSSDEEVVDFSTAQNKPAVLPALLQSRQLLYLKELLPQAFDFSEITDHLTRFMSGAATKMEFEDPQMQAALPALLEKLNSEKENTRRFRLQLNKLLDSDDREQLLSRLEKGNRYYMKFCTACLEMLLRHLEEVKCFSRTKNYQNELSELDQILTSKMNSIQKTAHIAAGIFSGRDITPVNSWTAERQGIRDRLLSEIAAHLKENPKNTRNKSGRKRKSTTTASGASRGKKVKGETYQITYDLFRQGKTAAEIAAVREMAPTTIEGHLARGISEGVIDINALLGPNEITLISDLFSSMNEPVSLREIYDACKGEYSFGKLRMVQAHLQLKNDD